MRGHTAVYTQAFKEDKMVIEDLEYPQNELSEDSGLVNILKNNLAMRY